MKMIDHIKYLLRFHDCVIIPGLGGLISHYEPSRRNIATGTISPPSKKMAFNPSLKRNDGLLIDRLIIEEGISYNAAEACVRSFKKDIEDSLQNSGAYLFEGIGKLTTNGHKGIQFHPIIRENLLLESFGLELVVAKPIQRIKETHAEHLKEELLSTTEVKVIPIYRPWYFRAAAAVGLIFILMTSFLNLYHSDVSRYQFSFLPNAVFDREIPSSALISNKEVQFNLPEESALNLYEPELIPDVTEDNELSEISTISEENVFYVVIGSFLNKDRLNNEIAAMKDRNYQVTTKPGPNGYIRVALVFDKNSTSRSDILHKVRRDINPQAWIPG